MEKRILIAFLLSLVVLYGSRLLFPPKETPAATEQSSTTPQAPALPATSSTPATAAKTEESAPQTRSDAEPVEDIKADQVEDFQVDTPLYTATLTNHGAALKSFRLKAPYTDAEGKPIELVDAAGAAKLGWPLAIATLDPKLDDQISAADFAVKRDGTNVSLEYAGNGIRVVKKLNFDPQSYQLFLESSVLRDGKPVPHSIVWQGGFGDQSVPPDPTSRQVVYSKDSGFTRIAVTGIKQPQDLTGARIGIEDQYFLAMVLDRDSRVPAKLKKQEYPGPDKKPVATSYIAISSGERPMRFYIGPKEPSSLNKADPDLAGIIDYGFFSVIARPLNSAMLWINGYVKNFGWTIIILTILINLVMFPLRLKQQTSMQKMQKVQPQMRTLQDKYKKLKANDPRRVEIQAQMMDLYKEHGINPMSGCLPLLLQMPFIFAIYAILRVAIDLRQAPWLLWIRDLSQPDPYYILPILMAVAMFISQKMTPTTVDPAQAKMMMLMPLMFTAFFLWQRAGLVLYWLTSNVVGIGQQYYINKHWAVQTAGSAKNRDDRKTDRAG